MWYLCILQTSYTIASITDIRCTKICNRRKIYSAIPFKYCASEILKSIWMP